MVLSSIGPNMISFIRFSIEPIMTGVYGAFESARNCFSSANGWVRETGRSGFRSARSRPALLPFRVPPCADVPVVWPGFRVDGM